MKQVQGWMPEFDIALLSAGEVSGRFDVSFKLLGRYYASRAKIIRDTINGLIVTIATLHVFFLIFPLDLFVGFVMGIINDQLFPMPFHYIINKIKAFGVLYGTVLFFIFAGNGRRGESWRLFVESVFQMIPLADGAQIPGTRPARFRA